MKRKRAFLALTLAMVLVGSSVVVSKRLADLPVFLTCALRYGIGLLVLVPILLRKEGRHFEISRRDGFLLLMQALTGVFGFSVLLLYGLRMTSATAGALITSTTPALVAIIAAIFLSDRPTWGQFAGIAFTVLGLVVVNVLGVRSAGGTMSLAGNALVLGAVLGEALFMIFMKAQSGRLTSLATSTIVCALGLIMFAPLGLRDALRMGDLSAIGLVDWLCIVYYGIGPTAGAYILWFGGFRHVKASTASVFTGVMPLSALALSTLFLGEALTWSAALGCVCVLAGIVLMAQATRSGEGVESLQVEGSVPDATGGE